VTVNSYKVTV